jgi:ribonucleoside-diphosphate reductase alpha chain
MDSLYNPSIISMQVIKRDGRKEKVSFDKILKRIEDLCNSLNLDRINPTLVAKETIQRLCDGITTSELDLFAANKCAEKIIDDPQYNNLAAGLCVSNLHKTTPNDFMSVTNNLYNNYIDIREIAENENPHHPLVSDEYYNFAQKHICEINNAIDYSRDYLLDFFSIKTVERYLNKIIKDGKTIILERPQHMFMRTAIQIHMARDDIDKTIQTYDLISTRYFTHASPTLFNAGLPNPQLSSCYLLDMGDSIDDIYETKKNMAKISKWGGGIGVHVQDVRAKGSLIRGTNGRSDGLVPMVKTLNSDARYVNQSGRRNGAIAIYIEPWHPDSPDCIELRRPTNDENSSARDIFIGIWMPDIFMQRVKNDEIWSFMCPKICNQLSNKYGKEFDDYYVKCEQEGKFVKQIRAKELWMKILRSQIETGMPYMLYKDSVNSKSNQKNIGIVKSSNLCAEIVEVSTMEEIAVCNLASIVLHKFVETDSTGKKFYNFEKLREIAEIITENLNNVIDANYYPVKEAEISNMRHRPIGVGVQGLADTYCMMGYPFFSDEAHELNKKIFETIYYGCLTASNRLAIRDGPYETFEGSPFSQGILQYHQWGLTEQDLLMDYDWAGLIDSIKTYGTRNSLLTALMPTASTSQIMGSNECFEPYTSNLYTRSTISGQYIIVNRHLVETLIDMGLWTEDIKNEFLYDNGSIQKIKAIPQNIKDIYKTAYDKIDPDVPTSYLGMRTVIKQAIERGPFIDQTQSMNIFCSIPNSKLLTQAHYYGWKNGLKTGMYYLRSRPAVNAIQFGLDRKVIEKIEKQRNEKRVVETQGNDNYHPCEMCSG